MIAMAMCWAWSCLSAVRTGTCSRMDIGGVINSLIGGHLLCSCTSASDCSAYVDAAMCNEDLGACVGCLGDGDCSAEEPVCDLASQVCRGCVADGECPSGLCDMSGGACVAQSDILYVDATGDGTSDATPSGGASFTAQQLATPSSAGRRTPSS